MERFYLGTHKPAWLGRLDVPLFLSRNAMPRARFHRARAPWALDSGGYTELGQHGRWTVSATAYAEEVQLYAEEIGNLEWAAPQDWMASPPILEATGLPLADHLERTVANLLELRTLAPALTFVPVLQGWTLADYLRCAELYAQAGVDLEAEPLVALGSIAARQDTAEVATIVREFAAGGLRLHGLGVKWRGLMLYGEHLSTADSVAWSYHARRRPPLPGCTHKSCANCPRYALKWRTAMLEALERRHVQGALW